VTLILNSLAPEEPTRFRRQNAHRLFGLVF
jgi:hypothetical protein